MPPTARPCSRSFESNSHCEEKVVTATNIILQYVPSSIFAGTQYLDITLTGSGEGVYITHGKAITIRWEKASNSDITRYYDENDNEIELNTGKTWVQMIENSGKDRCYLYATEEEMNQESNQ